MFSVSEFAKQSMAQASMSFFASNVNIVIKCAEKVDRHHDQQLKWLEWNLYI